VNKKQAVYWLSVAVQIHDEPEIIEAFSIAMDELYKQAYRKELTIIASEITSFASKISNKTDYHPS